MIPGGILEGILEETPEGIPRRSREGILAETPDECRISFKFNYMLIIKNENLDIHASGLLVSFFWSNS